MDRAVLSGSVPLGSLLSPGTMCLAVTSSTSVVGVAVGRAGARVDQMVSHQVTTDRRHAEELTPLLALTLEQAGLQLSDIECFVVDVGPGRFTGLRVGLATVRTLALVTARPLVGLTSLEILAGAEADRPLLAVIDARRGEVFQQRFEPDGSAGPASVGSPDDLAPVPAGDPVAVVAVGDGADRYGQQYGPTVRLGREPSAAVMIALAVGRRALVGHDVVPVYLRDPDVQINIKTRHTSPRSDTSPSSGR